MGAEVGAGPQGKDTGRVQGLGTSTDGGRGADQAVGCPTLCTYVALKGRVKFWESRMKNTKSQAGPQPPARAVANGTVAADSGIATSVTELAYGTCAGDRAGGGVHCGVFEVCPGSTSSNRGAP